jgi:hypothetical protein
MSLGSMSGVHWMRLKLQPMEMAMAARQHRLADAGHVLDEEVAVSTPCK